MWRLEAVIFWGGSDKEYCCGFGSSGEPMEQAGSTMMQSWIRFISFGIIAAALVMFAAFNSRAKAPRANSAFPRPALDQPGAATTGNEVAALSPGSFLRIHAAYDLP